MPSETSFHLFTSLRYDPLLLGSDENSQPWLNFIAPSPFYMLIYHRDRMLEAAQHFDFHAVAKKLEDGIALHNDLLRKVKTYVEGGEKDEPLKLRILYDRDANMTVEFMHLPPVPLSTLYPPSLNPPNSPPTPPHPAKPKESPFTPSPLTGGALLLGPTDALPAQTSTQPPIPTPPEWVLKLDTAPTPSTPFTLLKTTHRSFYDASRARALPQNPLGQAYTEVLLYNEVDELTEGSMTSLYFFRGGRWVTPPVGVPAGEFTSSTLKTGAKGKKGGSDLGIGDGEGEEEEASTEDEGELRRPFAGRWGHSVRSAKVGAGGQRGTSRRWALKRGFCMEEPVSKGTVSVGEGAWVSNGVRGFGFGRVVG
ncbi:hypothetical protein K458DRAFT_369051 [Lentithecium fluviatile CBS 122367]|uniref:Aminotransferase class IV n=1 Tax=Lentithecium fluviatile CBS 122367 TaxID=1168545 RepID=A0A6G1IYC3_9PLEO|nr:hypothetical protein K458DRAFT_369051 [Lentithecium fluviatile CBS 122367]